MTVYTFSTILQYFVIRERQFYYIMAGIHAIKDTVTNCAI